MLHDNRRFHLQKIYFFLDYFADIVVRLFFCFRGQFAKQS